MSSLPVIDCCVRATPRASADIVRRMPPHFRWTELGDPHGHRFVHPVADRHASLRTVDVSDPDAVAERVFAAWGAAAAIAVPPVYALRPDLRQEAAVARAINEWTAATWAERGFLGSICVAPADADAAVREIEHWAEHPRFVQVTVPMHVHAPYGDERYVEIWRAAAAHGLPVAVRSGGGGGVEFPASMAGELTSFLEYHTLLPLTGMLHVVSLISEGVFERVPDLTFVLTDGGIGAFPPLVWREDAKAQALKDEMPWLQARPGEHLRARIRFITRRTDLPRAESDLETLAAVGHADATLLYGSNVPMWDLLPPHEWGLRRDRVTCGNALDTYPRLRHCLPATAA